MPMIAPGTEERRLGLARSDRVRKPVLLDEGKGYGRDAGPDAGGRVSVGRNYIKCCIKQRHGKILPKAKTGDRVGG